MDRKTIFTKTAKGLNEATGKTSVLSRDMRALLKELDGRATVADMQAKFAKLPEAKLQEALQVLAKSEFIRELAQNVKPAEPAVKPAAPTPAPAAGDIDLDFTMAIPTLSSISKIAEDAAREQAQAAAASEAAARAKAEAEARVKAAAEAAARAKAEAEAKA
ncbi:MAG: hypothetical protein NT123_07865, partial [Proteobacteria bacterium]|nr:hypothetical protein [Pseudomonadota bacterium]